MACSPSIQMSGSAAMAARARLTSIQTKDSFLIARTATKSRTTGWLKGSRRSVNLAGPHGVPPTQDVRIGQIGPGSGDGAGLDQCTKLESRRRPYRKAGQGNARSRRRDCDSRETGTRASLLSPWDIIAAELAEDEDGVEAGVNVPVRFLDVPTAVGLLVPKHPGDHLSARGVGSPSNL